MYNLQTKHNIQQTTISDIRINYNTIPGPAHHQQHQQQQLSCMDGINERNVNMICTWDEERKHAECIGMQIYETMLQWIWYKQLQSCMRFGLKWCYNTCYLKVIKLRNVFTIKLPISCYLNDAITLLCWLLWYEFMNSRCKKISLGIFSDLSTAIYWNIIHDMIKCMIGMRFIQCYMKTHFHHYKHTTFNYYVQCRCSMWNTIINWKTKYFDLREELKNLMHKSAVTLPLPQPVGARSRKGYEK